VLERALLTYRRIWDKLPKAVRRDVLTAMKCWSEHDYEVLREDMIRRGLCESLKEIDE